MCCPHGTAGSAQARSRYHQPGILASPAVFQIVTILPPKYVFRKKPGPGPPRYSDTGRQVTEKNTFSGSWIHFENQPQFTWKITNSRRYTQYFQNFMIFSRL